jgi:ubiquinone/menaquinone biosynthesis C-methylase UbiE
MKTYLKNTYNRNDTDIISAFDELPIWSSYFGTVLLDTLVFKANATILDIGCGAGYPLLEVAQSFGCKAKVFGIDPWESATERLKQKAKIMKITNFEIINGYAESLPFPDNYFDLIISNNGLNNCTDQMKVLSECYRTMKKNSQFVYTVNLPQSMKEFYSIFEKVLLDQKLPASILKMKEHIKEKRKTLAVNLNQLRKNNLKVKDVVENSFRMRYIDGTAFLNHHFIKLVFLDSWVKIVPPGKKEIVFDLLENRLNKYAKSKGGLNLTIPFACFDCRK